MTVTTGLHRCVTTPAVVRCASTGDVVRSLGVARRAGLRVIVRGGRNRTPPTNPGNGSMVIDLSRMRDVTVDTLARTARVGGGAPPADLDAAAAAHGLAVDDLLGAEIVTADGLVRRIGPRSDADLFWAVRGGGAGLGVVTRFERALHPVPHAADAGRRVASASTLERLEIIRRAYDPEGLFAPR